MGTLHYQLRVRNAADDGDLLSVSTVPGDPDPHIASPPHGDGESLNPLTGQVTVGAYTIEVIDAQGIVPVTTLVAEDGFEYADLAALDAVWPETVDTLAGLSTWSMETGVVQEGAKSVELEVSGTAGSTGLESIRSHTYTGLTPSKRHRIELDVWLNEEFGLNIGPADTKYGFRVPGQGEVFVRTPAVGNTIEAWTRLVLVAESDGSGELTIEFGQLSSSATLHTRLARFDGLAVYELTTEEGRVVTGVLSDADARQQLLSKKGILSVSKDGGPWDVMLSGYVNRVALVTANKYDFTIGESKRVEQTMRVFDRIPDPVTQPTLSSDHLGTAISGVAPTLDRASCIIGGEIIGDWGPSQDRGRPVFEVDVVLGQYVRLTWVEGFVSTRFNEQGPPVREHVSTFMNQAALEYLDSAGAVPISSDFNLAPLPGLVARVYDVSSGDWVADHTPMALGPTSALLRRFMGDWFFVAENIRVWVRWIGTPPSAGDRVRLAVFPHSISSRNPFHVSGHPVDIATQLMTYCGVAYDIASAQVVKAALGNLVLHLRIEASDTLQSFLEKTFYGPFGFATRSNDDGEHEFFLTRTSGQAPIATVTTADLYSADGTAWELEEATAANKVVWASKSFLVDSERPDESSPIDGILVASIPVEVKAEDAAGQAVFGEKEIRFTLPGEIQGYVTGTNEEPGSLDRFVAALAHPLFDWQGRGAIRGDFHVGRWSPAYQAVIGEELVVNCPHIPSAAAGQSPTSQRGTLPRRGFVLHKTVSPSGATFTLEDRGLAAFLPLLPTFTLAADATFPKKVVEVTVTNEAALLAAGVIVRVEMDTSVSPTAGQFVRVFRPDVDANPFDLPPVCAGAIVSVRMRAEGTGEQVGMIGQWTAFQSLDLADLVAPSGLAATVEGTTLTLTWTNGEASLPVEVRYKLASATIYTSAIVLPPGSTSYTLQLPTASASYDLAVRHLEPAPSSCASLAATFTTSTDVMLGLQPPIDPVAFADGQGRHGLEVTATEPAAAVEFWSAVETSIGSGTAGTYVLVGTVASVADGRTRLQHPSIAPQDELLRFWKARHTRSGFDPSVYTAEVSINPWLLIPPIDPEPEPEPFPGLVQAPIPVPLFGFTLPRRFSEIPAEVTDLTPYGAEQEEVPLEAATAVHVTAVVRDTSLTDGAFAAVQWEDPANPGTWAFLDGESGPRLAIDATSVGTDLGLVRAGEAVALVLEARQRVRVRAVLYGGDGSPVKVLGLVRVVLWVQVADTTNAPEPEMPEPPVENPGEVCVGGPVAEDDLEYADLAALEAAWPLVSDTLGALSTWTVESFGGGNVARLDVSGTAPANGLESVRRHTFTGLTPNETHTITQQVWLNEEFGPNTADTRYGVRVPGQGEATVPTPAVGNTIEAWTAVELVVESNGDGEIVIEFGQLGSSATLHDRLARFGALTICEGSGSDTGLGDDGNEPVPTPPPGGYPPPPVGGARPVGIFNISVGGLGYWNSTHNALLPGNCVSVLSLSEDNGCMNMFKFGGENSWKDAAGRLNYDRWKAQVDAIYINPTTRAALEAAIAAGAPRPAWGHFVIDEPFHPRWGGTGTIALLDRMCTYSKSLFPTWPTILRVSPIDERLVRPVANCDIYWAEYKLANGSIETYLARCLAAVEAMDKHLILGIHYGAFDRAGTGRYITPQELRHYGGIFARSTSARVLALHGWKWRSDMHNQPGFQEAMRYVRDTFASNDP